MTDAAPVDLLAGLNPVQREAVLHGAGPLLVLAGAGSGKTRVVTCRIARLLRDGVRPERILAVTFTNKAAAEMRERVAHLLGVEAVPGLTISTFHAFGARFLRQHPQGLGRTPGFVIYDDTDQLATIKRAMDLAGVPEAPGLAKAVRRAIDQARNEGQSAAAARLPEDAPYVDMTRIGETYEELMARADAFDFGDLIRGPAVLLEEDAYLRDAWRTRFQHVLVDEFQDTNRAQYRLLHALAPPGSNLVVVGDDDQSIYGWRGAEVENILKFPEAWGGVLLRLEQNYRSDGSILEAANGVIAHNSRRLGKNLWTANEAGARVEVLRSSDPREEARKVVGRILELQGEGYEPGDVAILFRANHLALDVEDALRRVGVAYVVVRGRAFYERAEVRDALALLRLVVNPADDVAFSRVVGNVAKGVGKTSLERVAKVAEAQGLSLHDATEPALAGGTIKGKARGGLAALITHLAQARGQADVVAAAEHLFADVGLLQGDAELSLLAEDERDGQESLRRLLQALVETKEGGGDLATFLEQVKLVSDVDAAELGRAVSLMTVHAAKGLEFPAVFVIGLEEGTFPGARASRPHEVEEERRLFYVAATRARRRLFLSHAERRRRFGDQTDWRRPSRFLAELPPAVTRGYSAERFAPAPAFTPRAAEESYRVELEPEEAFSPFDDGETAFYKAGMLIWHADFGVGEVLRVRMGMQPRLDIRFAELGTRTVLARFVSPYEG
ncbi:MAG: UvrD-helicase domain-containing protein [Myxococcales bacterium]|nr:UvrD-helicase domain-containing protein [Myxococcales bacterium]